MERRKFIKGVFTASAAAIVATPSITLAEDKKPVKKGPNDMTYDDAVKVITGGKSVKKSDKITLKIPEIAENGAVVPVKVIVNHPMQEDNYVKEIHILNTANGNSRCADIMLTPANNKAYFATRVKLAKTQEVVALVGLSDGTFIKASGSVKVTIGGCG